MVVRLRVAELKYECIWLFLQAIQLFQIRAVSCVFSHTATLVLPKLFDIKAYEAVKYLLGWLFAAENGWTSEAKVTNSLICWLWLSGRLLQGCSLDYQALHLAFTNHIFPQDCPTLPAQNRQTCILLIWVVEYLVKKNTTKNLYISYRRVIFSMALHIDRL